MNDSSSSNLVYSGKVKVVETIAPDKVRITFTDKITAGDGAKLDELPGKGAMNLKLSNLLMDVLKQAGIPNHLLEVESETAVIARKLKILPVEVVVRNLVAGSFARRYGLEEGTELESPVVEFFLKDDVLHDPLIDPDVAVSFGLIDQRNLELARARALQVNRVLQPYFREAGLLLVDFKLEFGLDDRGDLWLADELSADSMRVWDAKTRKKLDKDRFRKDLGDVLGGYEEIYLLLNSVTAYVPEKQVLIATVVINPKEGITNPAGEVTRRTLVNSGLSQVGDVTIGKTVRVTIEDTLDPSWQRQLDKICYELLTNPLVEGYSIHFS